MKIIVQVLIGFVLLFMPLSTNRIAHVYFEEDQAFQAGELCIKKEDEEEEMYL